MTPRSMRRALERKAKKEEARKSRFAEQTGEVNRSGERSDLGLASPSLSTSPFSEARLEANQRNAQLSTGPRSEAGKAKSSQNSLKHGLYSRQTCVPGENPAHLEALKAELMDEHQPQGPTETFLVETMADHMWRLRRARRLEPLAFGPDAPSGMMVAIDRLAVASERGFYRALKTLREMQKTRGFVPQKAQPAAEPVPATPATAEAAARIEPSHPDASAPSASDSRGKFTNPGHWTGDRPTSIANAA